MNLVIYTLLIQGDPEELLDTSSGHRSERMSFFLPSPTTHKPSIQPQPLLDWKKIENLKLLNLTYDITPAKFITMVVCELGQIPSTLALSILRGRGLE
jgi:translation initiation factor eIF-2B subunit delta